ncbi:hypothetical protein ACFZCY_45230 [Streptomyces sp. NPDC007983]|uniref:hypothetical protein n=1 Tax=Streptomyces sp. NPDC007983 TaxID=3364800 RepID=UPI0036F0935A
MPRSVSPADAHLLEESGATQEQLETWRRVGLLPRNAREWRGKKGSASSLPEGACAVATALRGACRRGRPLRVGAIEVLTMRPEVPLPEAGVRWALSEFVRHRDDGVIRRIEKAARAAATSEGAADQAAAIARRFALGPAGRWPRGVPRFTHAREAVDGLERHTAVRALGTEAADVDTEWYVRAAQTVMARVSAEHNRDPGLGSLQYTMLEMAATQEAQAAGRRTRAFWRTHDLGVVRRTPFEDLIRTRDDRVLVEWVGRVFRAAHWSVPGDPTLLRLQELLEAEQSVAAHVPLVGPGLDEVNLHECTSRAQMLIEDCYPLFRKIAPLAPAVTALTPLLQHIADLIPRARLARRALQQWSENETARARTVSAHPRPGCDWCGRAVTSGDKTGTVADSSFAHPHSSERDGQRPVAACSSHHWDALHDHYGKRPFFDDEVQTAKIARVFHRHRTGSNNGQLAQLTGLSEEEVDRLSIWHNEAEHRGFYRAHAVLSRGDSSFIRRDFKITFVPGH